MFARHHATQFLKGLFISLLIFIPFTSTNAQQTLPTISNPKPQQIISAPLNASVRAALGPQYSPIQLPTMQQAKLGPNDPGNNDQFGYSISLSGDGNTALIGAYFKSNAPYQYDGSAYVFVRSGAVWLQQAKLDPSDKASNDDFGNSVALSSDGNTALVATQGKAQGFIFHAPGTKPSPSGE